MKKIIIGIAIGISIALIGGFIVKAATTVSSTAVLYNKNGTQITVDAAITELMSKSASANVKNYSAGWVTRSSAGQVATGTFDISSYFNDKSKGVINKNIFVQVTRIGIMYTTDYGYGANSGSEVFPSASYNTSTGVLTVTLTGSGCDWTKVYPRAWVEVYIVD